MTWKILIEKIENGFIVRHPAEVSDDEVKTGFQYDETDEFGELKCMEQMLCFVKGHFGEHYSKHNKKNIIIEIEDTN